MIKQKLTAVAVDAVTDYLREKLEALKKLDLDHDGHKDVDQVMEIVGRIGLLSKEAIDHTNFAQIASGLDQIMKGAELIRNSVDKDKIGAMTKEIGFAWTTLGHLAQLSIQYAKDHPAK